MSLTLYYHPLSSFCHKVLVALYERGVDFDKRLINLGDQAERAELRAIWPLVKFPVLRDGRRGRDVAETSIIIEYLDRHFAGARKMIPEDWDDALEVRLWDRVFDNYVQGPMNAIVADRMRGAQADMRGQRAQLDCAYFMVDQRIAARRWVAGDTFSMADCAAAPALFYASTVHPFPAELSHLRDYFERLMARPSVARVMEEARPYLSTMYPFADQEPV
ncbi:MAG: glutathione S-transferase family protein [Bdellovibrionales bacterium]|nr:glutathione S-transferase family protein [Massilia sp.]